MKLRLPIFLGFVTSLFLPIFYPHPARAEVINTTSKVIISEIKLGGDSFSQGASAPKDPQEFVTLYNAGSSTVSLDGWVLEYAKSTFDKSFCVSSSWAAHSVGGSVSTTTLSGTIAPGGVSTPIARAMNDGTAGSLHLVDNSNKDQPIIADLVGWGADAPCVETSATVTPSNSKSLKRYLGCTTNTPLDTDSNLHDFAANQPPSPGSLNSPYIITCQEDAPADPTPIPQATCEGVIISEILPNPAGSDTGNEFIELYNPTPAAVSLSGCSLQVSASSKVFNFSQTTMQAGQYQAFYTSELGLSLPNASGGTVWLLSPTAELQAIAYAPDLDDDQSWALLSGSWKATYEPTPSNPNIDQPFQECPEGEERNTDTGNCNAVASLTTATISGCREGQERNPETNRCRAIASSSSASSLTPCQPGQERNPDTNRCRAIASTASTLQPCAAGQERNPDTNRCRKSTDSAQVAGLATIKDVKSGSIAKSPKWWLIGFAALGAVSYGVYEWRQEIVDFLIKFKKKLPGLWAK